MSTKELEAKLEKAIGRREHLRDQFEAIRWVDGGGDDLAGLVVDGFGTVSVIHLRSDLYLATWAGPLIAEWLMRSDIATTVYLRQREIRPEKTAERGAVLLAGESIGERWISEFLAHYKVRPEEQVNSGFFIDMRETRQWLIERSDGRRVLNLFCFTGSLGIAAALGGASEVVQVDISKRALTWARENYLRNFPQQEVAMRFLPDDCRVFLEREIKRMNRRARDPYDIILLDPPAFGRSEGKPFRLERELGSLISQSLKLLSQKGSLIVTTNSREIPNPLLKQTIRQALKTGKCKSPVVTELLPPKVDFRAKEQDSTASRGFRIELQ